MIPSHPRVTIGIPVYNGERYLAATLECLLAQTYEDFEIIVSDNASTDGTAEICRDYAARDPRIRYYRSEENRGAAWNHNRLLELAGGEYFKWQASDDLCAKELLARAVAVLDDHPACVLCYGEAVIIDGEGAVTQHCKTDLNLTSPDPAARFRAYQEAMLADHGRCNAVYGVMRTKVLQEIRIGNYPAADMILLGELALRGEIRELPEYLFFKRDHAGNSIQANTGRFDKIAVWFDPRNRGKIIFPRWKWLYEYLKAIHRARLSGRQSASCYLQMGKWVARRYRGMIYDLLAALIMALRLSDDPYYLQRLKRKYFPDFPGNPNAV